MVIIKETSSIRCSKCGCVFEFDNSDIIEKTKTIREDGGYPKEIWSESE